jgi:hypothetical protein
VADVWDMTGNRDCRGSYGVMWRVDDGGNGDCGHWTEGGGHAPPRGQAWERRRQVPQ